MNTTSQFNALAIKQYSQSLNTTKQWELTHAYQKGKSYLWQAIAFLNRLHYEDAFNYNQNSDKVTETVTNNLYQISKPFTKAVKSSIEFCTSIKRFLLLVSTQVSTEKALFLMVTRREVATLVATQNALYKWKHINKSLMLNREVRSKFALERFAPKYAPKTSFLMRTYLIIGHVRREFCDTLVNKNYLTNYILSDRYTTNAKAIKANVIQRLLFILGYPCLFSFSRQAVITQAEKLEFSFFARSSICSIKSWGKRMFFNCDLLFLLPVTIVNSLLYKIRRLNNNKKALTCLHTKLYIGIYTPNIYFRLYKTIAQRVRSSMDYLTQPLTEVMIMANRYDSAHLRAEQSQITFHKKDLPNDFKMGYSNSTLAKSKGRIETLFSLTATHDAPSVFFCVNAYAYLFSRFSSMVALAGQLKSWLVSVRASSLNPVNVTAQELETSSGDYNNHLTEAVTMTTTPSTLTPKQFKFYNPVTSNIISVIATNEVQARKNLGKQSLIFIARKPPYPTIERSRNWGGYSHV